MANETIGLQCVTCYWLSLDTCCSGGFYFFFQHVSVLSDLVNAVSAFKLPAWLSLFAEGSVGLIYFFGV